MDKTDRIARNRLAFRVDTLRIGEHGWIMGRDFCIDDNGEIFIEENAQITKYCGYTVVAPSDQYGDMLIEKTEQGYRAHIFKDDRFTLYRKWEKEGKVKILEVVDHYKTEPCKKCGGHGFTEVGSTENVRL